MLCNTLFPLASERDEQQLCETEAPSIQFDLFCIHLHRRHRCLLPGLPALPERCRNKVLFRLADSRLAPRVVTNVDPSSLSLGRMIDIASMILRFSFPSNKGRREVKEFRSYRAPVRHAFSVTLLAYDTGLTPHRSCSRSPSLHCLLASTKVCKECVIGIG